jgi:GntR family transcriptional regulator, rspAB operon transcriptional repressor
MDSYMAGMPLRSIDSLRGPSAADLVFEELYRRIVELLLPPGAKLSEQDVARQMGVSRQPVRDAFWRLSQVGLLQIQPQRATTVAPIAEEAIEQARFVRTALETETARGAARTLDDAHRGELTALIAAQEAAVAADDRVRFHALDDAFHQTICAAAGKGFVWSLIRNNKAHMDRARWLSLSFGARAAFDDHVRIFDAVRAGDAELAAAEMRAHLGRIVDIVAKIRGEHPEMLARR